MKRIIALFFVLVMLLSMVGCGNDQDVNVQSSQLQAQTDALENEKGQTETQNQTPEAVGTVYALHATIDGESTKTIDGETTLTAQAVLAEGMVVDHWELNGEAQVDAAEDTFTFDAADGTIVEAVLRAEKKVTTVNCKFRFLNEKDEAAGDPLEEFVFEESYNNPVTGAEVTDGTISLEVKAEVPSGYVIDYWKINGVEYHFDDDGFVVRNLDEATEYEVVLKERPITYYKVTCINCTVNGQTEVWVPAGSTVTAAASYDSEFVINGTLMNNKFNDQPYVSSWSFTVNCDTTVAAYMIVN